MISASALWRGDCVNDLCEASAKSDIAKYDRHTWASLSLFQDLGLHHF